LRSSRCSHLKRSVAAGRRVEDAGLLRREVSNDDARVRYLRLTKRGERQLTRAVTDLREERSRLAAVLGQL
jgi:DNA-binding MarR family transcriptional regulator